MGLCYRCEEMCPWGQNEVHQPGVHCGRNCALERSRRQSSRVPTMRSLLLPCFITAQTNLQERTHSVVLPSPSACCGFNACGILSILFESSFGLILDLEFFVLLPLCAWPPCHPPHTCLFWEKASASFEKWGQRSSIITRHWKISQRVGHWM